MDHSTTDSSFVHKTPLGFEIDAALARRLDHELRPFLCALAVGCHVLRLSEQAQFTAACLLTRYYAQRAIQDKSLASCLIDSSSKDIIGACLFLGAKVSEESRRLRDVINCIHMIEFEAESKQLQMEQISVATQSQSSGDAATRHGLCHHRWNSRPPPLDETYWESKRRIIELEQHVLRWIGFDTFVLSPHGAIVIVAQHCLLVDGDGNNDQQPKQHELIREAWKRINNATFSIDCLRQPTMALACAAVDAASSALKWSNVDVPYDQFKVSVEQFAAAKQALNAIEQQLLETV